MLMIVDLPAPFSPITPWMLPRRTVRETSLLAWLAPNHLLTPVSLRAGGWFPAGSVSKPPCAMLSVIPPAPGLLLASLLLIRLDLEFARDDPGLGGFDLSLHVVGDQRLVVVVQRIADAVLLEAEDAGAACQEPSLADFMQL